MPLFPCNSFCNIRSAPLAVASAILLSLLLPALARAQEMPWHAPGWGLRLLVQVDGSPNPAVDVACVRVNHFGAAAPTANDYRVFNSAGQPVPYLVAYHDPARDSLISFRCPPAGGSFAVYFGKPDAPVDPLRALFNPAPGGGPPTPGPGAGGWVPQAGLVLATMRRPRQAFDEKTGAPPIDNPNTVPELASLIGRSPGPDGAAYVNNISDGYNRFGDSDFYISAYRGWIDIPADASYGFCTASNESSFSFLDGKDLVHWPGRHTETRGRFGEKNAVVKLSAGRHYVEYYQEEVLLYQMAFLGWSPPGSERPGVDGAGPTRVYSAIPEARFPQPAKARIQALQDSSSRQLVFPRATLLDSYWPPNRSEGQYTRYAFVAEVGALAPNPTGWTVTWSFGDGQTAQGMAAEHVYLRLGTYNVAMTAVGPAGQRVERSWPQVVYLIDVVAGQFRNGSIATCASLAATYDRAKLDTAALTELARLQALAGQREPASLSAQAALARKDLSVVDTGDMHVLIASVSALGLSGMSGSSRDAAQAAKVAQHLQAALAAETDPVKRLQIATRAIRAMGIDQADIATASALYEQAVIDVKKAGMTSDVKAAFRDTTIAIGDAHLFAKDLRKANEDYRTAEALAPTPIPQQVRTSKIGAYPEAIEQQLLARRYDQAMMIAREWQDELPSDQIRGAVLFYVGKLERLQGRPAAAVRPLQLAIELAQGAEFEAEARWTLAESYKDLLDFEAQRRALNGLVRSGMKSSFRDDAINALKEMGKKPISTTEIFQIGPSATAPASPEKKP
ncbi:MAG: PKD domain-containing protein [Planctomycetota bacterium]|nr:PKD domain-containing protein [Planctomycetota bacterium]